MLHILRMKLEVELGDTFPLFREARVIEDSTDKQEGQQKQDQTTLEPGQLLPFLKRKHKYLSMRNKHNIPIIYF